MRDTGVPEGRRIPGRASGPIGVGLGGESGRRWFVRDRILSVKLGSWSWGAVEGLGAGRGLRRGPESCAQGLRAEAGEQHGGHSLGGWVGMRGGC